MDYGFPFSLGDQLVPNIETEANAKVITNQGIEGSNWFSTTEYPVEDPEAILARFNRVTEEFRKLNYQCEQEYDASKTLETELQQELAFSQTRGCQLETELQQLYIVCSRQQSEITLLRQNVAEKTELVNQIDYLQKTMKEQKDAYEEIIEDLRKDLKAKEERLQFAKNRIEELEKKVVEEKEEKWFLVIAAKSLEEKAASLQQTMKSKDEAILELREEKKEAIRNLCVGIESLKKSLSKNGGNDSKETA